MKTLSLNILDIVQNSIRAKATEISIEIEESRSLDHFAITISDNGTGIPKEILANITDPFVTTRTTRKIGLGLSLLKYRANLTGGELKIDSEEGTGTVIKATFRYFHIDRQPLGDIAGVIMILLTAGNEISITYKHITENGEYIFSSKETKEYLEVNTLNDNALLPNIKSMINENLKDIGVSDIN
jgi:hypothetical protein